MSFEYLKIKRNKKYKNLEDEELVKIAQQDIDSYRNNCDWSCPKCKNKIPYSDSLLIQGESYIHETRSYNVNMECKFSSSCKKKLDLKSRNNKSFNSDAFTELFARYQGWIVHESEKAKSIDSPEEIYCELCSAFTKIVGMFARTEKFSKTSEKWFSSFFFRSIQNKISDIQKTKNYQKRSPLIKCEICGDYVGKITSKHLLSEGHEDFVKNLYIDLGKHVLEDSGEIEYYKDESDLEKRAIVLGAMSLAKKEKKEAIKFLKLKSLFLYFKKFPNAKVKNNLLSTNMPIDEEESSTIEDTNCESVTICKNDSAIEDIYVKETVEILVNIFYIKNKNNYTVINKMFKDEEISLKKRKAIIREIIFDKMSYENLKNSELDRSYGKYVKSGFTSRIFSMMKNDSSCRIELMKSLRDNN